MEEGPHPHIPRIIARTFTTFLLHFRNIAVTVGVLFTIISTAFLFIVGVYHGATTMTAFFAHGEVKLVLSGLIKTMDIFLAALVMMLLAVGLYDIFIIDVSPSQLPKACQGWRGFDTLDS